MKARGGLSELLRAACNLAPRHAFSGRALSKPDDSFLENALWVQNAQKASKFLVFDQTQRCFTQDGTPAWIPYHQLKIGATSTPVLLAADSKTGELLFAVDGEEPESSSGCFTPVRSMASSCSHFDPEGLALVGQARNLLHWHARARFCGICGGSTLPKKAGWKRECSSCSAEHFPRLDAVAIMVRRLQIEQRKHAALGSTATGVRRPTAFACLSAFAHALLIAGGGEF